MAKENLFDKVKKAIKGEDDRDSDQDHADESEQVEVIIDGKKVIVPNYIAINLKSNKK